MTILQCSYSRAAGHAGPYTSLTVVGVGSCVTGADGLSSSGEGPGLAPSSCAPLLLLVPVLALGRGLARAQHGSRLAHRRGRRNMMRQRRGRYTRQRRPRRGADEKITNQR